MIEHHRDELVNTLKAICKDTRNSIAHFKKMNPPRFSSFLWHLVKSAPMPVEVSFNDHQSQALRKIHDFYGWKAKDTVVQRGLCSGALYRTGGFLAIPMEERVGKRDRESRTVHIEHSVPIGALMNLLPHHADEFETPGNLHNFVIRHSVITALSHQEEKDMTGTVRASRHPGFEKTGQRIGDYPFLRYEPLFQKNKDFRIYDVVSGKEIDIRAFTYKDHEDTLTEASKLCGTALPGLGIYDGNLFNSAAWFLRKD